MKLRLALIALLTLSSMARADEGDGPRAPEAPVPARAARAARPPRAPAAPAVPDWADQEEGGDATHTDTTLAVPARVRLELENFGGEIVVASWDRKAVRVQAEYQPGTSVDCEVGPATIVLRSVRLVRIPELTSRRRVRVQRIPIPTQVDYRLTVPRSMNLRLSGVNTRITVAGVEGDISAETVNGRVAIRGGRGNVKVSAVTGGVEVIGSRGSIEASSVNDDVTLQDVEGPVHAESVSGDVILERIGSDEVEASTVSGNLRYSGTLRPGGSYQLESHSGDLTVILPEHPDVTISADTYSGEFSSSFLPRNPTSTSVRGRGKEFEFTLGDGRAELSLESFSGLIRLERAGESAGHSRVVHIHRDK
jgi:hypothetical protein